MSTFLRINLFFVWAAFCGVSNAAIGDYKVVLIHGFQANQLQTQPSRTQVEAEGEDYWKDYWMQYSDARIDWPSQERVEGKIASDYVWPKLQELSRSGTCQQGCIFITHSTGDLVARYLLDNQENWLTNAGLTPLNVVATLDFAGAGGGTSLGDIVVNMTEGGGMINRSLRKAISLWLGDIPNKNNIGVLNDLKVSNARQIAMQPENRIPRIRFVGNGSDYYKATSPFLLGKDDGVVAGHSSCGSSRVGSFDSCSTEIAMNGKVSSQKKGVTSFMPNHYPFIMGSGYSHTGVIGSERKGMLTPSSTSVSLADSNSVKVEHYQTNGWFGRKYIYVQGSQQHTMSEIAAGLF